jgi:alpha-D-ribose 1-methylphosphonate 5-triphosphate diphosphatase PhnM
MPARSAGEDILPAADGVAQLEQQASRANPRDQVFLYTELVHTMAQQADREIADGETVQATVTLQQVNRYAHMIHLRLARGAKRLKDAQELMHNTTYRLAEVLHLVSGEDRAPVQETLNQLDQLNEELLTQVFTQ